MAKTPNRPTLQHVADLVGVTKMTVSRFLTNPDKVSKPVQQQIASAIETLGYIPNRVPNILSKSNSKVIGVLVPSLSNQVFADVINGIESITREAGFQTMFSHYGYSEAEEEKSIESLLSYQVDGLILAENNHTKRTLRMIKTAGIPVVEMMDINSTPIDLAVGFDNVAAADSMVSAMIESGCRQIHYFAARMDTRTRLKQEGYIQAMNRHNLDTNIQATSTASSVSVGSELAKDLILQFPDADGIFCTNDDLAIGAFFACQKLGISVPNQIAIAGFHGLDIGQVMTPKLATVVTPRYAIGQITAKRLLNRIHDEEIITPIINLGYRIELGESLKSRTI